MIKYILIIGLLCGCLSLSSNAQKEKTTPWVNLFNGENFEGWDIIGGQGVAKVIDGVITCNMKANTTEHTFICSKEKYGNFILEIDIKTDTSYNSGILLRSYKATPSCDTCYVSLYGYQIKLDSRIERRWTGGIFYDYGKTWHWLHPLEGDDRARYASKLGEWNHFRIEAIDATIKVWINDIPVTHLVNSTLKEGYIGIKIHSLKNMPQKEKDLGRYKNIKIITDKPEKYSHKIDIPAKEAY